MFGDSIALTSSSALIALSASDRENESDPYKTYIISKSTLADRRTFENQELTTDN